MKKNIHVLLIAALSFLVLNVQAGISADREKELDEIVQEIIFQHRHVGDPSDEEMLTSVIKTNKATHEEIEGILLRYLAGKGELTEGHFGDKLKERLKSSSILFLGYIKSRKALPFLKKMITESIDERTKYSCALAILQIEDDPVPFIGEILSGKVLPENFQYMGALIEKIQTIYKEEAKKAKPDTKILDGIKEALIKYVSACEGKTSYLLNADYVLCAIDVEYGKSETRKKVLIAISERKGGLNEDQKKSIEKKLDSFGVSP